MGSYCVEDNSPEFCTILNLLPIKKQEEINRFMGNICEQHPSNKMLKLMENGVKIKRKPNFMRFGRSGRPNVSF